MRRETSDIQTKITVEPFVAVAVAAIENSMRGVDLDHPASADVLAHGVMQALDVAGFAIVPKPQPISTAASRIEFARRTGNWSSVSDRDYREWVQSLTPGNVLTIPPGTEIRAADVEAPERNNLGLSPRSADDMAERFGCRVEISGMDDADTPLTDEFCEISFVVVTERATGRVVGLVQAWETDDGDPLVPQAWLSTVLSAWDAARDPQQAA
ncbi:hypothetical protein MPAR168_00780 [Methylorubrum populi]|uniref:Uncharacterized protein n=1 Tax=Methylobacterium radiotolerans TaxID=31998 RepID=A0ABU7T876_9HYPH